MKSPKLKLVGSTTVVPDIYAAMRAEIKARDWVSVHIEADRRRPFAWFGR